MKKIALALLSFVLAAATWAGLYAFFFSVGKENYVAVIATYGVLPILFLTKVIYDAYDSAEGQMALAVIGFCFLAGFALLARLARPPRLEGFVLAGDPEPAP